MTASSTHLEVSPVGRRAILCLGLSQLISWGVTYYLVGAFGEAIAADLGWSRELVYGGFSAALLTMGLSSPVLGRLIDRHGGRRIMIVGALLNAAGCAGIACSHSLAQYYVAWAVLGLGMRATLYDAAFAALARIAGPEARRPMSQITLLGGLASTVFWPLGHALDEALGWRGALLVFAGTALLVVPLLVALPAGRYESHASRSGGDVIPPLAAAGRRRLLAASLYVLIVMLANLLNSGMSAHMIVILSGLGVSAGSSVLAASLRGIGQSSARLGEVLFGRRVHPLTLNLAATLVLPLSFFVGLAATQHWSAAVLFAFLYGVGNGIVTITRGTVPLVLFDHRTYGSFVGSLVAPSFLVSAAAPILYAAVIDRFGGQGALLLSAAVATAALLAAAALRLLFGPTGP